MKTGSASPAKSDNAQSPTDSKPEEKVAPTGRKIAQMTDIWVRQNLPQAVGDAMTATILAQGWEFERKA
ncbi:MAG TPA: hypothetical protein VJU59_08535 [Paraburkholderia sp.]|uniref:hypothetical protein n=1 Tax=Paraburkholderia sp. TaxID=1926495 RepID=UPI002B4598C6|nr:hypothetical protein [Paraburkholderia sp.]HKR39712.1 hypothetical protein [Paraburkholderia sp.]